MSNTTLLFLSIMGFFLTMITIISCCFAKMKLRIVSEQETPSTLKNQTQSLQTVCSITEEMEDVTVEMHNVPDYVRIL